MHNTRADNIPADIKNFIRSLNEKQIATSLKIDDD